MGGLRDVPCYACHEPLSLKKFKDAQKIQLVFFLVHPSHPFCNNAGKLTKSVVKEVVQEQA
jgi:hypothetical protein